MAARPILPHLTPDGLTPEDTGRFWTVFKEFEKIAPLPPLDTTDPTKKKKKKIKKKVKLAREQEEAAWRLQCSKLFLYSETLRNEFSLSWPSFFRTRMVFTQTILQKRDLERLYEVIKDFHKQSEKNDKAQGIALELLTFLQLHEMDPDSALIGMPPSANVQTQYESLFKPKEAVADSVARSSVDDASAPVQPRRAAYSNVSICLNPCPAPGTVVIVPDPLRYVRVSGSVPGGAHVEVFVDPSETRAIQVSSRCVAEFSPEMARMMDDVRTAQKLVSDPIDKLYEYVIEEIKCMTSTYLKGMGIDMDLLERASQNELDIPMWVQLTAMKKTLDQFPDFEASPLCESVKGFASQKVKEFLDGLNVNSRLFLPTKEDSIRLLKTFEFSALSKARIQRCRGVCDSAVMTLRLQMKHLMDGRKKRQLTDWWLVFIEDEVRKWLKEKGYDFDSIPEHYTHQPPKSHEAVRDNLRLIKEVLDRKEDKHQVQEFLERLKNEIYPKIDQFVDNARISIATELELEDKSFDPKTISELIQARTQIDPKFDPKIAAWITEMSKDIVYLEEMREMEKASEPGKLQLSNVVPIGGLILSCFFRIENELNTIQDLWPDPKTRQLRNQPPPPGLSSSGGSTTPSAAAASSAPVSGAAQPSRPVRPQSVFPASAPPTPPNGAGRGGMIGNRASMPTNPPPPKPARPPQSSLPNTSSESLSSSSSPPSPPRSADADSSSTSTHGDALYEVVYSASDSTTDAAETDAAGYYEEGQYYDAYRGGSGTSESEYLGEGAESEAYHTEGGYEEGDEGVHYQYPEGYGAYAASSSSSSSLHTDPQSFSVLNEAVLVMSESSNHLHLPRAAEPTPPVEERQFITKEYPNGDKYKGQFLNGKRDGRGLYIYSNGDVYDGNYTDGKFEGPGVFHFATGDVYEGEFGEGLFHGQGTFKTGSFTYTGGFQQDRFHGYGELRLSTGDVYSGEFSDDVRHGPGTYTYADGIRFEGLYYKGQTSLKAGKFYGVEDMSEENLIRLLNMQIEI